MARTAVSAFAARKAARRPIGDVTDQNDVQESQATEIYHDPLEEYAPPKKKQKVDKKPKSKRERKPQQTDGSDAVLDGSTEAGAKAINSDTGSISDTELETVAQSTVPVRRLSSFDMSRSKVLSETETEWTVRLHPKDVSFYSASTLRCKI